MVNLSSLFVHVLISDNVERSMELLVLLATVIIIIKGTIYVCNIHRSIYVDHTHACLIREDVLAFYPEFAELDSVYVHA